MANSNLIAASIDITKIDKSKLGKGKYLNFTISVNGETNQYGQNVAIVESQSKEDRDAKVAKNYLGNGKVVWSEDGGIVVADKVEGVSNAQQNAPRVEEAGDDLPF